MDLDEIRAAADRFLAVHVSTRPAADQSHDARAKGWQSLRFGDVASAAVWFAVADKIDGIAA